MRAPGQGLHKAPLFVWAMLSQSVIIILCIPVLAGALLVVLAASLCLLAKRIYVDQHASGYQSVLGINGRPTGQVLPLSFCQWFAGLVEGDGTIILPKGSNARYPQVQVAFAIKDLPLAEALQRELGHGTIQKYPATNSCRITFASLAALWLVVSILNGQMRTGKHEMLKALIAVLNQRCGTDVQVMPLNTVSVFTGSWFAGFTDADGHFSVRLTVGVLYPRVAVSYELTQSILTHLGVSNHPVMLSIATWLQTRLESIREATHPAYRLRAGSVLSVSLVRLYFTNHPLFSSKHLDYLDWCRVNDLMLDGVALASVDEVASIKAGMNSNRTHFDWSHLDNLLAS